MKNTTLGELKKQGYQYISIKEELRNNLIKKLQNKETVFTGIHGFEDTVIPELERAILSKHNINLLGLRGQAKTRIARQLTSLLNEYVPVVAGSEINDDPFFPISIFAKNQIDTLGDNTPISWLHRNDRFSEKLATPDVTIADIIGDVDPIKAATLKLSYASQEVIHFGMIPRANRCIFVINELPDLQARIQVALFNILQEGDIQIRGFKLRFPVDVHFVFTANPEDYTNRGSIVTPLKDRIGSQILTHYPENIAIAKTITSQEIQNKALEENKIYVPEIAKDLLEQIVFEARESEYVDVKSGVSARMSITMYENLLSTAERRMLLNNEEKTTVRLSDFMGIIPAITGKVELVYEGEQEGGAFVAQKLIEAACKTIFTNYFPKIEKLEKQGEETAYSDLLEWFFNEGSFQVLDNETNENYEALLQKVKPLHTLVKKYLTSESNEDMNFYKELVLWALVTYNKLSKERIVSGFTYSDLYGNYINKMR
jgi:magnesium chelatase subunit I